MKNWLSPKRINTRWNLEIIRLLTSNKSIPKIHDDSYYHSYRSSDRNLYSSLFRIFNVWTFEKIGSHKVVKTHEKQNVRFIRVLKSVRFNLVYDIWLCHTSYETKTYRNRQYIYMFPLRIGNNKYCLTCGEVRLLK